MPVEGRLPGSKTKSEVERGSSFFVCCGHRLEWGPDDGGRLQLLHFKVGVLVLLMFPSRTVVPRKLSSGFRA